MRLSRFFIDETLSPGQHLILPAHLVNYIVNVLRLKTDAKIILFNGRIIDKQTGEFSATLTEVSKRNCVALIENFIVKKKHEYEELQAEIDRLTAMYESAKGDLDDATNEPESFLLIEELRAELKAKDDLVKELVSANPECCWRKCWGCGKKQIHRADVTPGVLCRFCGSQDTRLMKKETQDLKG